MPVNLTDSTSTASKTLDFIRKDAMVQGMLTMTPAEVYTWIDTNVTTLATAKDVLKRLAAVTTFLLQAEIDRRR